MGTSRFVPPLLLGEQERTILATRDSKVLGTESVGGETCVIVQTHFWSRPAEVLISEARGVLRMFRMRDSGDGANLPEGTYSMVVTYDAEIEDP
jgi:hypothetical protein